MSTLGLVEAVDPMRWLHVDFKALRCALKDRMPELEANLHARAAGAGAKAGVHDPNAADIDFE